MDAHEEVHIVLVHGTWGRRSSWALENSYFRDELANTFGGRIRFYSFKWSGWNSHYARIRAALRLNDFILKHLGHLDGSKVFVVAHSHGGNVVSYAAAISNLANAVAGFVFLGTPFIYFRRRSDLPFWQNRILPIISIFYYIALLVAFFIIMFALSAFGIRGLVVPLIAFSCFFAFDHFFARGPRRFGGLTATYAEMAGERAERACQFFHQPEFPAGKVFICQCSFDEASIWLRIVSGILKVARWTYEVASAVFRYPKSAFAVIIYMAAIVYLVTETFSPVKFLVAIYSASFILVLGSAFFIKYLTRLLANQPFSLGSDPFIDNLVLEITVSKIPNVVGIPESFVAVSKFPIRFLNHCSYYIDENAVGAISQWMKKRLYEG